MIYFSFLVTIVILFISIEIYFIGKYFAISNNIFKNNEAAIFVLGSVIYFVITFFSFFIFIWIKPTIFYFVVILLIKEGIQITFLILRREKYIGIKINFTTICISIFSMVTIPFIFNLGFYRIMDVHNSIQINNFQTWFLYKDVISTFTKINLNFINEWAMSSIAVLIIYNTITSFIIQFSKKKSFFDYLISYFLSIGLILIFSFGLSLDSLIGIFLLLFAIQLSINIIMKSRRRYALIFGMVIITLWFFDPKLFLVSSMLSISVALTYTFLKKPKASLFWVQLSSPMLLISALWLYNTSNIGSLILVIISIFSYLFMVSVGRTELLEKIDHIIYKMSWVMPLIIFIGIITTGSILVFTGDNFHKSLFLYDNAIWWSFNNSEWNTFQSYFLYIFELMIISFLIWYLLKNKKFINHRIIIIISTIMIIGGYNFSIKEFVESTMLQEQFNMISIVPFMPITLLGPIMLRRRYIKI